MSTILHPGVNCLKVGCGLLDTIVKHYLLRTLKNVSRGIQKSPHILVFQRRLPKEDFGSFKISEQSLEDSPR